MARFCMRARVARTVGWLMVGSLGGLVACRDSTEPPTSIPVEFRVSADIGPGDPARSVAIVAHYRRTAGQQVALPVNPATIDAATGSVAAGTVSVDVLPCVSDPNREPVSGTETNGCRVYLVAQLRAPNGTPVSEEENVVPVARSARSVTVAPFELPSGALVPSVAAVDLVGAGSGQLPAPVTVSIASSTVLEGGELTASIQYLSGAGWLTATVTPGGSAVTIAPASATLAPGVYEAIVRVTSARMFAPAEVAVRYQVPEPPRVVSITGAGNGTGLVLATPSGASCTTTAGQLSGICTVPSPHRSIVELTPAPAVGSGFTGWAGACEGAGSCRLEMDQDRAVTATFTILKRGLTVEAAGPGDGTITSTPAGISCTATGGTETGACTAQFDHPTQVTLRAAPNSATSTFTGWSGACEGTAACVVTMSEARSVTATFALIPRQLTVIVGEGSGTVISAPAGIECTKTISASTGTCAAAFGHGTSVTLTAVPGANMTFMGWSGAGCTGTGTCTVMMDQARTVTATIVPPLQTLTIEPSGNGIATVQFFSPSRPECRIQGWGAPCVREFPVGVEVELYAASESSFGFLSVDGCDRSYSGLLAQGCFVVMNGPRTIRVTVIRPSTRVTVVGSGTGAGHVVGPFINCRIVAGVASGECFSANYGRESVVLTATPDPGSTFAGWLNCSSVNDVRCLIGIYESRTVTAIFTASPPPEDR